MYPTSDRFGDLDLEEVLDFEGLEPNDEREIDFNPRPGYSEVRSFEEDFDDELEASLADEEDELPDEGSEEEDYQAWLASLGRTE